MNDDRATEAQSMVWCYDSRNAILCTCISNFSDNLKTENFLITYILFILMIITKNCIPLIWSYDIIKNSILANFTIFSFSLLIVSIVVYQGAFGDMLKKRIACFFLTPEFE